MDKKLYKDLLRKIMKECKKAKNPDNKSYILVSKEHPMFDELLKIADLSKKDCDKT